MTSLQLVNMLANSINRFKSLHYVTDEIQRVVKL